MRNKQLLVPFGRELASWADDLDRFFLGNPSFLNKKDLSAYDWAPEVDLYEDKEGYHLSAELPGLKKEDVNISMENGVLSIHGEKKMMNEEKKENYRHIGRYYGRFERNFTLPKDASWEQISAVMKDGVLEVMVPKREESKPKNIDIRVS